MLLNLLIINRIKIISEKSCFISNHNCELIKKKKKKFNFDNDLQFTWCTVNW